MLRRLFVVLKASSVKKGGRLAHAAESFINRFVDHRLNEAKVEERVTELRQVLHLAHEGAWPSAPPMEEAPAEVARAAPSAEAAREESEAAKPEAAKPEATQRVKPARRRADPLSQLIEVLETHPKREGLVKAGRQKDQLLRSLIPLYLAQQLSVSVSSGTTSRFWAKQGVKYAAPNAAKALREHEGYARRTSTGPRITPAGVEYVEAALAGHQTAS